MKMGAIQVTTLKGVALITTVEPQNATEYNEIMV
jgi:hypothetical protein